MRDAVIPAREPVYLREWPLFRKLTGFRFFERNRRGWEARFNWLEASGGWGLGLELIQWNDDGESAPSLSINPGYGRFYFKLPMRWARVYDETQGSPNGQRSWGFSWRVNRDGDHEYVHLHWGARTKLLRIPFRFDGCQTEIRLADGRWAKQTPSEYSPPFTDGRHVEVHLYRYLMRDGSIQERMATIYAERRTWTRKGLPAWLPGCRMSRTSIEVTFSDGVGERVNSWKGGCIGCAYDLKPGETMEACLRRMERERVF